MKARLFAMTCAAVWTAGASPAAAQPAPAAAAPAAAAPEELPPPFGVSFMASAALDNPAFAGAAGARYRPDDGWLLGVDVEWNPWASIAARTVRAGALNVYVTGIRRWDMRAESVKLRTSAHLGTSILLFDLYGAPSGSVGLYLGLSLLGLEIRLSRGWYLLLEPADVAIPAPHLSGAPLTYRQYRFTVGLQVGG